MAPRNPLLPLGSKDIIVLAQNVSAGDCEYRMNSNRHRGFYFIFHNPAAAFIRGRSLFGGGVYSNFTASLYSVLNIVIFFFLIFTVIFNDVLVSSTPGQRKFSCPGRAWFLLLQSVNVHWKCKSAAH